MEYRSEEGDHSASGSVFNEGSFQATEAKAGSFDLPRNHGLVPDYIEAMQLEADPFSPESHTPEAEYLGAGRQEVLDQIDHLSEFSASVLVVSGAIGSGKTTLFENLCQRLAAQWNLCSISAQVLSSTELIFERLATALQAEAAAGARVGELMAAIRHRLLQGELEPFMLLVDDAHLLDDTVLGALMSLLQSNGLESELPFHVILLGDEALIHRLDGFSLVDVLLHDLSLQPFNIAETREYLLHRLNSVGWTDELPFDDAELSRLHIESEGNPARLNESASRLLIERVTIDYEQLESSAGLPITHLFSVVVLLGVLIMAYFYKDSWFAAQEQALESAQLELLQNQSPLLDGGPASADEVSPFSPDVVVQSTLAKGQATLQDPLSIAEATDLAKSEFEVPSPGGVSEPVALSMQEPPKFALPAPVLPQSAQLDAPDVEDMSHELAQLTAPAASHPRPSVSPQADAANRAFSDTLTADEQVLMALDAGRYVLQVMAAGSKSSVEQFIASQPNRNQLKLFTTWRQGKPWHVVVVGDFDSSSEARQGAAKLPQAQKKAGPWPRSAASIQSTIKDFRRI